MKVELIIIASEILNGKTSDANTFQLAQFLNQMGLNLRKVITVSDDEEMMTKALQDSWNSADLVITSGGLGPTKDDLTKVVVGNFFSAPIEFSELALQVTKSNYERFDRVYTLGQNDYSQTIKNFIPLNNPKGFAPGYFYRDNLAKKILCLCPGVPSEFIAMIKESLWEKVTPYLEKKTHHKNIIFKTYGIPEEKIFKELCPNLWEELEIFGNVSSLPHYYGVDIGVAIDDENLNELLKKEKSIKSLLEKSQIRQHIWSQVPINLEEKIIQLLHLKKKNLILIESCTGGLAAHLLTNVPGSSNNFYGSMVSYQNDAKKNFLHLNENLIHEHGAVSSQVAEKLAQHALENNDVCNLSLSFTGFAGPGGGDQVSPVGTLFVGLAYRSSQGAILGMPAEKLLFRGSREILKQRFTYAGLHHLRKFLEQCDS